MSIAQNSGTIHTSTSVILINFYQLLQIPFKLGFVKFVFQIIINGWCTSITNVEVTFVAAGFFTINSKVSSYFLGPTDKPQLHKTWVPSNVGEPKANKTYH